MTYTVAVSGASGYAGGEILRLLAAHPDIEIRTVTAHSNAGQPLIDHQPHLRSLAHLTLQDTTPEILSGHDIVFLALPHGQSGQYTDALGDTPLVIDAGADHRLTSSAAWDSFYGGDFHEPWAYGVPELLVAPQSERQNSAAKQREHLRGATRIAAPGCNASTVSLSLVPGVAAGVIDPGDIVSVLAVGPSGAGKSLKTNLLASEILGTANPYAVGGTHRHIPEIRQALVAAGGADPDSIRISFTPVLVPMSRGILATSTAPIVAGCHRCGDPRRLGERVRRRDLRAAAAGRPLPAHRGRARCEHRADRPRHRPCRQPRHGRHGRRQSRQGHRWSRHPVHEHRARSARGPRPLDERSRTMSVTTPQGFEAAGVAAGLKSTGKPDVAVVVNRGPRKVGAAVFTSNRAKANPIIWSQQAVADRVVEAVVLNSGGANCFTGAFGFQTTHQTAEKAAELLGVSAGDVLICSTGLIGVGDEAFREKVLTGTAQAIAELSTDGGQSAAEAIMTTDSVSKTATITRDGWTIGGMAKGAGMLAPGLATMLVVHHDGRRARAAGGRCRSPPRHRADVRPARLRRLHVDERPGHAARQRRQRHRPRPRGLRAGTHRAVPRTRP